MSWTSLKNGIATVIKTNGNQEITGNALQGVFNTIVNSLGAHATFAGIAVPSTSPGTPDGPVFYFALQVGSYSNFGATPFEVSEGEFGIFVWDSTTWSTIKYTPGVDLNETVSELSRLGSEIYGGYAETQVNVFSGTESLYSFAGGQVMYNNNQARTSLFSLDGYDKVKIAARSDSNAMYVFLKSLPQTNAGIGWSTFKQTYMAEYDTIPDSEPYFTTINQGDNTGVIDIPSDAVYLMIQKTTSTGTSRLPASISLYTGNIGLKNKVDALETAQETTAENIADINSEIEIKYSDNVLTAPQISAIISKSSGKWADNGNSIVFPVKEGSTISIQGRSSGSSKSMYSLLTSDSHTFGDNASFVSGYSVTEIPFGGSVEIVAPQDCYLYIAIVNKAGTGIYVPSSCVVNYDGDTIANEVKAIKQAIARNGKTIYPELRYESITNGGKVETAYSGKTYVSTPRYIAVPKNFRVEIPSGYTGTIYEYGSGFSLLSTQSLTGSQDVETDANYIKLSVTSGTTTPLCDIALIGDFVDGWDVFNERPSDSGYQRVVAHVNVTNPTCTQSNGNTAQDVETILPDYGVICLPSSYRNIGKKTRLIIYCHGAAVNYADNVTRFNSTDLEPDYWLNEGYAILDIEGNPFDNINEHFGIPQAQDSYVAAYKWAIEHYNLYKEVFVGGRSMGGLMAFLMCKDSCPIPALASCPNVPAAGLVWEWEYMNATRRAFAALHMGFVGTAPTWSSSSPMTSAEWAYLKANGYLALKNSIMSMVVDCPSVDDIFADANNISKTSTSGSPLLTQLESCHMRVKCPVKQFYVMDDETVTPAQCCLSIDKMLKNAGMTAEIRLYADGGGHHHETDNDNLRCSITTRQGVAMTNVPVMYVEMLQFWRRYEQ